MFRLFKRFNNESGIVMFMVLLSVIVMMIVSVTILSQSINEINFAQQQIDEIGTDQLQKGIFWTAYSSGMQGVSNYGAQSGVNAQGRTYSATMAQNGATTATANAYFNSYVINSSYDSFQ